MKTLKFRPHLAEMILAGDKTTTWRLFDDKDLSVGDQVVFKNWDTGEDFATAELLEIWEKTLGELEDVDFDGHEKFESQDDMLAHYRGYYGDKVNLDSSVKIIRFKLV